MKAAFEVPVTRQRDKVCEQGDCRNLCQKRYYASAHGQLGPQQNGIAKQINCTILEKARSMTHYEGVPTEWWARSTAVYLINRSTNLANSELGHLRVFG